ncbi:hypothetical protein P7K49_012729 [Saguinus oedipus]|uniref:Uncharacterized protein n=1 Tax=Saguinus oedipus TaxID=9490 RepID=A0ABQ9VDX1_SAGOE|nr:hypothetical protein P7K49_012729 [Saguinus oedipus]
MQAAVIRFNVETVKGQETHKTSFVYIKPNTTEESVPQTNYCMMQVSLHGGLISWKLFGSSDLRALMTSQHFEEQSMPGEASDGLSNLPSPFAYLLTIHLKEGRNLVVRDRCVILTCIGHLISTASKPGAFLAHLPHTLPPSNPPTAPLLRNTFAMTSTAHVSGYGFFCELISPGIKLVINV